MFNIFLSHILFFCCLLNSATCGSDWSLSLLFNAETLFLKMVNSPPSPPQQLPLPNSPLHWPFLYRKCLCPNALTVTAPLILKNIGCTDSPRLLCFGGVRRPQWIVFLKVSWILNVTTEWLLLPLPRRKRNTLPEVSLCGKTRRMAHWRLFCRRIHFGTKLRSAIFWCWNRNRPWQRNSVRAFVLHIPISCNW